MAVVFHADTVFYWYLCLLGFQVEVDKFFLYVLCLILTTLVGSAVGFCVSAGVQVFAIANLLMALTFVFMMVSTSHLVQF